MKLQLVFSSWKPLSVVFTLKAHSLQEQASASVFSASGYGHYSSSRTIYGVSNDKIRDDLPMTTRMTAWINTRFSEPKKSMLHTVKIFRAYTSRTKKKNTFHFLVHEKNGPPLRWIIRLRILSQTSGESRARVWIFTHGNNKTGRR